MERLPNFYIIGPDGKILEDLSFADIIAALGYTPVPDTRTLTIDGVSHDLSADRSWTTTGGSGTVTSVAISLPSAFSVAGSPITTSGTFLITCIGSTGQYIKGDGTLGNFPSIGGGGGKIYYMNGGTSQGVISGNTYYQMSNIPDTGTAANFSKTGDGLITSFITDAGDPDLINISGGSWTFNMYASMNSNGGSPQVYVEIYIYDGVTFNLIGTTINETINNGTTVDLYTFSGTIPSTTLSITDRIALRFYLTSSGGKTITLYTQDNHLLQLFTTIGLGITSLNGINVSTQYFAKSSSGTDFDIISSGNTHTFYFPTASSSNRGLLSSTDWSTFNNKQNALGFTPYNATNPAGYISGITSLMISTALGFTPYNSSNPAGYITSAALAGYLTSATAAATYFPIPSGTTSQYIRGDGSLSSFPSIPAVGTWGALNYPTWISGTPFVKMTAAGIFALDTNSYLTSISGLNISLLTNDIGYITSAALAGYLTSATAAATYYPLSNPSAYISGITSLMITTALGYTPYNSTNPSGYITNAALAGYLLSSTAAATYFPIPSGTTAQYLRGDGSLATFPAIPSVGSWGALNYPTWISGTPFVKMTAAGTFALDTTSYIDKAVITAQGDIIYGSASATPAVLAKDTNATRYLSNQGTSNNPSWNQVNLANGVTGVLPTANGGMDTATYHTILQAQGWLNSATALNTFWLVTGTSQINTCTSGGSGNAIMPAMIYISSSDYPTVNGLAPKLRIRANLYVNNTAPTGTWTFGLYPMTSPGVGSSGGVGVRAHTIGTVVSGSNGAAQASPAAATNYNLTSSDFALPANGWYAICINISANVATNSTVQFDAKLQIHNA